MRRTARSMKLHAFRLGAAAAITTFAVAAVPATASAASISLGPSAPADGTNVKFNAATAKTPIGFTADTTGCTNPLVGIVIPSGPRPQPIPDEAAVVGATGSITATWRLPKRRETYSWYLELRCDEVPLGGPQARTEARTITLLPPSVHARLKGRFIVSTFIGKRRFVKPFRISFIPIKPKRGALRSRDSDKDIWVYNKRTRSYRVRDRSRSSCEGRGRTIRGGSIQTITSVLKVRRTDIVKARRFVRKMVGTWRLVERPTTKGRRAGCRAFRAKGRIIMVRKGRVVV